jgi:putative hydrolase of the HAD superfamily
LLRRAEGRARRRDARERAHLLTDDRSSRGKDAAPGREASGPSSIRAVLFDAGATLLYPDPPVERVYARVFTDSGVRFSERQLFDALTATWIEVQREAAGDRYGGVRGEADFWRSFLNRVRGLLDGGTLRDEDFEPLAAHFRRPESWAVFDDVLPALDEIAGRGLALAVVSNWDSFLPRLLEMKGLSSRFAAVSVSAIEETGKPEPEIFLRTCRRLGVAPAEALHVGDSPREDYEGARAAGLRALLLDRKDQHRAVPERIRSLAEIPRRLASAPAASLA